MPAQLTVVVGELSGCSFPIPTGQPFRVGRDIDCELCLTDPHVSRLHCQLSREGDRVHLVDLHSTSGTFIGGVRIDRRLLLDGDVIVIGKTKLMFQQAPLRSKLAAGLQAPPSNDGLIGKPLVGTRLGEFEVLQLLDTSPRSSAYRVEDRSGVQHLLRLFAGPAEDLGRLADKLFERFVRLRRCQHPALLVAESFTLNQAYCWFCEPWISGTNAAHLLELSDVPPMGQDCVVSMARQISDALQLLHSNQIYHGDIHPRHLWECDRDRWMLAGLVLHRHALSQWMNGFTSPHHRCGELAYRAPESLSVEVLPTRGQPDNPLEDIYGLGACMFAMLTNRLPRSKGSLFERSEGDPDYHQTQLEAQTVDRPLRELVVRMLAETPAERPATMQQVSNELGEIVRNLTG